ncbi:MAG: formate/nitrite transporter family protein [Acidimicrobiales bacterium]
MATDEGRAADQDRAADEGPASDRLKAAEPDRAPAGEGTAANEQAVDEQAPAGRGVRPPPATDDPRPREEPLEDAFDRIVAEGKPRLHRAWPELLATGTVAGTEVALGILALLAVEEATHSVPLGGLAFSIGFIALLFGHSELFTEGFLVPVTVVAAKEARTRDLLRLWVGTLAGNLAGGWVVTWLIDRGFPGLHHQAVEAASYYINGGINLRTFCLAVLAGSAITLLTRMHNGTDSDTSRMAASIAIGFLLAGVGLFHSILDSLLIFAALSTGAAPFGYLDWLGWFWWTVLGNMVGGIGLTTLLRLLRSRRRLSDQREAAGRRQALSDQAYPGSN